MHHSRWAPYPFARKSLPLLRTLQQPMAASRQVSIAVQLLMVNQEEVSTWGLQNAVAGRLPRSSGSWGYRVATHSVPATKAAAAWESSSQAMAAGVAAPTTSATWQRSSFSHRSAGKASRPRRQPSRFGMTRLATRCRNSLMSRRRGSPSSWKSLKTASFARRRLPPQLAQSRQGRSNSR